MAQDGNTLMKWKFPKEVGPFTLAGYSKAADATFFYIPELKLQLDMGGVSKQYNATSFFISHSHMDHCIYMPSVQPAFIPKGVKPNDVYVPKEIAKYVVNYLHSAQELNNSIDIETKDEKQYNLCLVEPNMSINFGKNYTVSVYKCTHGVPSVGYGFKELRQKLKQEFQGKSGKEIKELKAKGVDISETIAIPKFVFLGDTTIQVFEDHPELLEYPVIIVECTFLEEKDIEHAHDSYHIHWKDLEPYIQKHANITFVLIHFSLRYKDSWINQFFDTLPQGRPKNIFPWASSVK
eukprot:TRINITY_DN4938_c0_g1_i1.p1 TRINITY_DN4938_c0_g1~~TRINITY_DN4938_c0_g1_i1.p1  ORF type:complete len:317 (+),score=48.22 TRINITY_DN4938_c0_g1_i1:74-952(+)